MVGFCWCSRLVSGAQHSWNKCFVALSCVVDVCTFWALHSGGVSVCLFHPVMQESVRGEGNKRRRRGREEGDETGEGWDEWVRQAASDCWHYLSASPDKYAKLTGTHVRTHTHPGARGQAPQPLHSPTQPSILHQCAFESVRVLSLMLTLETFTFIPQFGP